MKKIFFFLVILLVSSCSSKPSFETDFLGNWDAYLDIKPDRIPFGLSIQKRGDNFVALLQNDTEFLEFEEVSITGPNLKIILDTFDAEVNATVNSNGELIGTFHRNYQTEYKLNLYGHRGKKTRFPVFSPPTVDLSGKWETSFIREDGSSYPAIGVLRQVGQKLFGTFITSTGDYRFLEGNVSGNEFYLSAFDGGHAFLFSGNLDNSDSLVGKFRSGPSYTEQMKAVRNETFELPDPNALTHLKSDFEKFEFRFPDSEGKIVSLNDSLFSNKIVLIQIFGTWCINCLDETKFLIPWYQQNKHLGIEIVGLAFEAKPDFDYASGRVRKYQQRLGVPYPLLIAGEFDKQKAAQSLPALVDLVAFPTLIYLDRNQRVRRINTGFTGPGTGPAYLRWIESHELLIQKLMAE